jgi:hypothetical protein
MMPPAWDKRYLQSSVWWSAGTERRVPNLLDMPTIRRAFALLVAGVLTAGVLAPVAGARSHPVPGHQRFDDAQDCDEYLPEKVKLLTGNPGPSISLDVVVLHDDIEKAEAETIVTHAARSYAPLNIVFTATYKKVAFRADPGSLPPTASVTDLLAGAKALNGGIRPEKSDVVLVLTNKDIYLDTGDVVGYSDCIGGIRYPDRAFAIVEAFDQRETVGALNLYMDLPAKTVAHELGHLLGARHEHANCAEGGGSEAAGNREPSVCTLMTTYVDFQSRRFGAVESGVIRAHAESYATP